MSPTLAGRKLVQAAFTVTDLARSIAFYRDVLGLPLLFETNGMAFFQAGELRLMVGTNSPDPPARGTVLYFDAPDIDALAPALEAKGVAFIGPTTVLQRTDSHELKLRIFRDPDGNPIGLMGMVERV
jgi:catechol 2,3-dioxygenase-like lactoylglutathione lyase family enzyme